MTNIQIIKADKYLEDYATDEDYGTQYINDTLLSAQKKINGITNFLLSTCYEISTAETPNTNSPYYRTPEQVISMEKAIIETAKWLIAKDNNVSTGSNSSSRGGTSYTENRPNGSNWIEDVVGLVGLLEYAGIYKEEQIISGKNNDDDDCGCNDLDSQYITQEKADKRYVPLHSSNLSLKDRMLIWKQVAGNQLEVMTITFEDIAGIYKVSLVFKDNIGDTIEYTNAELPIGISFLLDKFYVNDDGKIAQITNTYTSIDPITEDVITHYEFTTRVNSTYQDLSGYAQKSSDFKTPLTPTNKGLTEADLHPYIEIEGASTIIVALDSATFPLAIPYSPISQLDGTIIAGSWSIQNPQPWMSITPTTTTTPAILTITDPTNANIGSFTPTLVFQADDTTQFPDPFYLPIFVKVSDTTSTTLIDGKTIKTNTSNELMVDIDNDTIYYDATTQKVKAKEEEFEVLNINFSGNYNNLSSNAVRIGKKVFVNLCVIAQSQPGFSISILINKPATNQFRQLTSLQNNFSLSVRMNTDGNIVAYGNISPSVTGTFIGSFVFKLN